MHYVVKKITMVDQPTKEISNFIQALNILDFLFANSLFHIKMVQNVSCQVKNGLLSVNSRSAVQNGRTFQIFVVFTKITSCIRFPQNISKCYSLKSLKLRATL
jgi:hypothetical protein